MPKMADLDYQYMTPITVTATGIATFINNLKLSTSSGFDGIHTKILKHTVVPSSTILSHIFQQSLSTGELPNDWKVGKIMPIFKSGDKSDANNYRPISLTSVPCKLLEHIIFTNVVHHLECNNFFFKHQHGFRKGFSCETQLIEFTTDLFQNMDDNAQTDSIFIDFSKAFDRVAHCRLISKLSCLDELTISWIRNFFVFSKAVHCH